LIKNSNGLFARRFQIIASHKGGMAHVLICQDLFNHKFIAAKTPILAQERFSKEARLWIGLGSHPNIVTAHIVQKINDRPYLFMDFVGSIEGNSKTLRDAITNNELNFEEVLDLGISVILALRYAESVFSGFVHRDLKPENILIDDEGHFLVSDFGISHIPNPYLDNTLPNESINNLRRFVDKSTPFTKLGTFCGTPGYSAPEQYEDSSNVTFKADLYSLGVILHETLTGKIPGKACYLNLIDDIADRKTHKSKSNHSDAIINRLRDLILQLLEPSPENRPDTLEYVENILKQLKSEYTNEFSEKTQEIKVLDNIDSTALSNRIYSLIALKESRLATIQLFELVKRFPWSGQIPGLSIQLVSNNVKNIGIVWRLLILDVLHFSRAISLTFLFGVLIAGLFITLPQPKAAMATILMGILLLENYVNARSMLTLDKITYPGIITGLVSSFVLSYLNLPILAGSWIQAIVAPIVAIISLVFITKLKSLGFGTVKLIALVSCFVGYRILFVLIIWASTLGCRLLLKNLSKRRHGSIKWKHGKIVPNGYENPWDTNLPTSNYLWLATWIVLISPLAQLL
jgi:serine/threonine protein kinase